MSLLLNHRFRTLTAEKVFFYLRKIAENTALFFLFPVAYMVICIYSLIKGKKFRVAEIDAKHLGGWAYSLDSFLRRVKNGSKNQINYLFVMRNKRIANYYFYELMKKHVNVIENPFVRLILLPVARIQSRFKAREYGYYLRDDELDMCAEALPWFDEHDHAKGRNLLMELGLNSEDAWYVCFFARDNAYNESTSVGYELDYYKTYDACRNADIDVYIPAIKFILENGGYVIRMGSVAKKRISYSHPRLIDYPFSRHRSEFADIYLACHCKFFIGNGSGIVDVSVISDVPLGMVDQEMYILPIARKNLLYIPKLMKFSHNGEYVSVKEYFNIFNASAVLTAVSRINTMKENGIIHEDNSEDDVLMITQAFYERFITKSATDKKWEAWQEGGDCCRPFNHYHIWGPFIDKHRYLI